MNIQETVEKAVKVLKEGGVILYPTDTVWALGCDATNPLSVEKIFKITQSTDRQNFVVLVQNIDMIYRYIKEVPEMAPQLIDVTDTPLTIIYPGATALAKNLTDSNGAVGMRIPDHDFCQRLFLKFRKPLMSAFANSLGEETPLEFNSISEDIINNVDFVVDQEFEIGSTGKLSSVIQLGLGGEVKIIRK